MTPSLLSRALRILARCTVAFVLVGLALGVWAMFERVPPMAESGRKPTDIWSYALWVPILGVLGALAGFAVGTVAALASAAMLRIRILPLMYRILKRVLQMCPVAL